MKRLALLITTLFLLTFAAQAQDRAATEGPVWSITEFRFKPNKRADYMKFVREHRVPVLMEWKRQGLIVDYKFYFNPTSIGPQEPELVEAVLYRNFGEMLDGDEARGKSSRTSPSNITARKKTGEKCSRNYLKTVRNKMVAQSRRSFFLSFFLLHYWSREFFIPAGKE